MKYLSFINNNSACIWIDKGCLCGSDKQVIKSGKIEHEKEYFCSKKEDFYAITEFIGDKEVCSKCLNKKSSGGFYNSQSWKNLRYKLLKSKNAKCSCCGRDPKTHNIDVHVDHIKPRSKFPELALDIDNLQILCGDCNLGKGVIDETDWR